MCSFLWWPRVHGPGWLPIKGSMHNEWHGSPQSWGWLSRPELGKRAHLSPPQTPHPFSDVRRLTTPMPGQLIAHPINWCVTKSTARPSSLPQVWLISVLTTGLIPTGCGPLPGVIQKSFTPWLGVYRVTVFVMGFVSFLPPFLPPSLSPSHLSFLPLLIRPPSFSYSYVFIYSFIHLFRYCYNINLWYVFIHKGIHWPTLLIKPGIIKDIMRIIWSWRNHSTSLSIIFKLKEAERGSSMAQNF